MIAQVVGAVGLRRRQLDDVIALAGGLIDTTDKVVGDAVGTVEGLSSELLNRDDSTSDPLGTVTSVLGGVVSTVEGAAAPVVSTVGSVVDPVVSTVEGAAGPVSLSVHSLPMNR